MGSCTIIVKTEIREIIVSFHMLHIWPYIVFTDTEYLMIDKDVHDQQLNKIFTYCKS